MSVLVKELNRTGGKFATDLQITEFSGGRDHGCMLQLTQGFGGTPLGDNNGDTPGMIQLTKDDVVRTIEVMRDWLSVFAD